MKNYLIITVVVLASTMSALAQDGRDTTGGDRRRLFEFQEDTTELDGLFEVAKIRQSIHLSLGGGVDLAGGSFKGMDGVPSCCPEYSTGSGPLITLGGEYRFVGSPWSWGVGLRGLVEYLEFDATEQADVVVEGLLTPAEIRHHLELQRGSIVVEATAYWEPAERWRLLTGPVLSIGVSRTAAQSEMITTDAGPLVFVNTGTNVRNSYSGSLPSSNVVQFGWKIGAEYAISISDDGHHFIVPQLTYTAVPTDPARGIPIMTHQITASASVSIPMRIEYERMNDQE